MTDYLTKSYPGKPKPRGVLVSGLVHAEIDGGPWLPLARVRTTQR